MADYGSADIVRSLLKSEPSQTFNALEQARIDRLLGVMSRLVEEETGRVWGGSAATASAVRVWGGDYPTTRLLLPRPARSVSAVAVEPGWDGSDWSGGTALAATDWAPDLADPAAGILALRSANGSAWYGHYLVTATWYDDQPGGDVPAEIDYVVSYLAARQYQVENSSTSAESGPEGGTLPVRAGWNETTVKRILERYRRPEPAAVVL